MSKRYWSLIESPFQKFAAWVDEEGRLLRFNLRATGASIVEMEAAGAARAAEDLDLPFYCIRAVSDLADETFENDFNAALTSEGQFSTLRLVTGALARPRQRFGELLRLKRRTDAASKKLGDFLADCTF